MLRNFIFNSLTFKEPVSKGLTALLLLWMVMATPLLKEQRNLLASQPIDGMTGELYAGFAQVDITPPVGYSHYRGVSTGVHDPLYAKAVVWGNGDQRVALVVCDLLWVEKELSSKVRLLVSQEIDIPYTNMIIAGTHSHTGPSYHLNIDELNSDSRPASYVAPKTADGDQYPDWLVKRIAQSIVDADKNAAPVIVEAGKGTAEGLSFNRRSVLKDGTVRMNAGVGNPDIIRAAGPVDPEVGILLIRRASDNVPLGCVSSFGIHADTFGGTEFSADYPGYLAQALSEHFGEEFVSVFGTGACGDINHVDVRPGNKRATSQEIGETLANVVQQEIPHLKPVQNPALAFQSDYVYAPLQQYSEEELAWALPDKQDSLYNESAFLTRRRAVKIRSLHRMRQSGEAVAPTIGEGPWIIPLEVQVLTLGDNVAVVGVPGEIFTQLSLSIKEASPFETTLVIELTNSHIAYVPTKKAFLQGSYETINSRLAPGGGELMVEAAIQMLNDLKNKDKR